MSISCPHCGSDFEQKKSGGSRRSYPQLKRFFALVKAAYLHWPDSYPFRPKNKDHLRYWLQVEAGHFEVVKTIRCESVDVDLLAGVLTAVMRTSEDDKQFVDADGPLITVKRTISIGYEAMAHLSACKLFSDIDDVIKVVFGIEADELLQQTEASA